MTTYRYVLPAPPPSQVVHLWDSSGTQYLRVTHPHWQEDRWQPADDRETALTWEWLLEECGEVYDTDPRDGQSGWQHATNPS